MARDLAAVQTLLLQRVANATPTERRVLQVELETPYNEYQMNADLLQILAFMIDPYLILVAKDMYEGGVPKDPNESSMQLETPNMLYMFDSMDGDVAYLGTLDRSPNQVALVHKDTGTTVAIHHDVGFNEEYFLDVVDRWGNSAGNALLGAFWPSTDPNRFPGVQDRQLLIILFSLFNIFSFSVCNFAYFV